jgi:hypothetical protein
MGVMTQILSPIDGTFIAEVPGDGHAYGVLGMPIGPQ